LIEALMNRHHSHARIVLATYCPLATALSLEMIDVLEQAFSLDFWNLIIRRISRRLNFQN
jgi:hypothetical protein